MKKNFYYLTAVVLFVACSEQQVFEDENEILAQADLPAHRQCAAMEVLEMQLKADPKLSGRMSDIEIETRELIESGRINELGQVEIPVIVNVIYRTSTENISLQQISSQIDVLNEDFNATNADLSLTPGRFVNRIADLDIQFVLAGVNRKQSNKQSWNANDDMKRAAKGGVNPTAPDQNLNIWVVNKIISNGDLILGYAQFPGGDPATDGVVIGYNFFGRTGMVSAPYNKGRTTTHEVGHWLNLLHIWGDDDCGDDLVGDTPPHDSYNFGCPETNHLSICNNKPEMTMNYMDYTDDACMYMFTKGQKNRARAVFNARKARVGFAQ